MNTNEKKVIVDQITANEVSLKSFLEMQQDDILSEVRRHLLGIFHRQVLEIAEENSLLLEWARFFFDVNDLVCKLHPMEKSNFGYYIVFGFIEKFNNLTYGIDSNHQPYLEEHRKIIFDKKGHGLVNFATNDFTEWLWLGRFEEPLGNWNNAESWLAIYNGTLKDNFNTKIKELAQIVKSFDI